MPILKPKMTPDQLRYLLRSIQAGETMYQAADSGGIPIEVLERTLDLELRILVLDIAMNTKGVRDAIDEYVLRYTEGI